MLVVNGANGELGVQSKRWYGESRSSQPLSNLSLSRTEKIGADFMNTAGAALSALQLISMIWDIMASLPVSVNLMKASI
jgi:hypothetical protein